LWLIQLNESFEGFSNKHRESLISAISVGLFFVLIGSIFMTTPNLFEKILAFFRDFDIVRVPHTSNIFLPAPVHPFTHRVVYVAVEHFSYVWGLFQVVVLALRLVTRSPLRKDAETMSNIVFWLGTGFLTRTFLIETVRLPLLAEMERWFVFWSGIIMLLGVSLIVRAIVLAVAPRRHVT